MFAIENVSQKTNQTGRNGCFLPSGGPFTGFFFIKITQIFLSDVANSNTVKWQKNFKFQLIESSASDVPEILFSKYSDYVTIQHVSNPRDVPRASATHSSTRIGLASTLMSKIHSTSICMSFPVGRQNN